MTKQIAKETVRASYHKIIKVAEGELHNLLYEEKPAAQIVDGIGWVHKIMLLHNHPSGDTNPSREDEMITKRLVEVGKIVGIEVLDHLIVGSDDFYSFKENGKL